MLVSHDRQRPFRVLARYEDLANEVSARLSMAGLDRKLQLLCTTVRICGSALGYLASKAMEAPLPQIGKEVVQHYANIGVDAAQTIAMIPETASIASVLGGARVVSNTAILMPNYFVHQREFRAFVHECHDHLLNADPQLARQEIARTDALIVNGYVRGTLSTDAAHILSEYLFTENYRNWTWAGQPALAKLRSN